MPPFTKWVLAQLSDDAYAEFQNLLIQHPDAGKVVPGGGGLRKVRCKLSGQGKRGGARVIYYWVVNAEKILLIYAYNKNEQGDLSPAQIKALKGLVERELHESRSL